ncbi:MAG: MCE family protein [Chlorobi bacterium]|nr:MCE family protein [Chlorobiota bacterium]
MKLSKYVKLGILMVFTILIFIWGLSYLKGNDIFKQYSYYYVIYNRVDGLVESSPVNINGFKVGQVKEIKFTDDNSGRLIVTIMIDGSLSIPVNSVAQIVSSDIMGTKSVKLIYQPGGEMYQPNDTIPGAVEKDIKEQVSMQVLPLKTKAEELLATIDSAITILTVIFNEDARENLSESFKNINNTFSNIERISHDLKILVAEEKGNISNIIGNLDTISESFKNNSGEFDNVIKNLSAISDSFALISFSPIINSITDAASQIEGILEKLNSEDGSAGKLINNKELYENLVELTGGLDRLMQDIRMNPKRYLHFSAFDLGKEVYIASSWNKNKDDKIIFRINLISTPNRIPLNSTIFDNFDNVEEFSASGAYSYLFGSTNNYDKIVELQKKAIDKFPDATIIAFRKGKVIKLERALKILNK